MKVVCKLKFGKLLDNKKDFRSKNFFGAEPRALKVEWVAKFGISKSWFFNFDLKFLAHIMDSSPSLLTQHLEYAVSSHKQKKWGELGQKWASESRFRGKGQNSKFQFQISILIRFKFLFLGFAERNWFLRFYLPFLVRAYVVL